jgi:hypothetical protein
MNRAERRKQAKLEKKMRKTGEIPEGLSLNTIAAWKAQYQKQHPKEEENSGEWHAYSCPKPDPEPREPEVPGINAPPVDPEFEARVNRNSWHNREELAAFMDLIWNQSDEESLTNEWSWSRNWDCKYVDIRFDMRDGGFTVRNREGKRISLEQLKWQYKSLPKETT